MWRFFAGFLGFVGFLGLLLAVPGAAQDQAVQKEQAAQKEQVERAARIAAERARLKVSPGERLARAMGDITVESLNGMWIFSTPSKAAINRYELKTMHTDPMPFIEGIDLDEETPVIAFHRSVIEKHDEKNAFVLVDPDADGCDVFFWYRTKAHSSKGRHYRSDTWCFQAMLEEDAFLTGGRNPKSFRKPDSAAVKPAQ